MMTKLAVCFESLLSRKASRILGPVVAFAAICFITLSSVQSAQALWYINLTKLHVGDAQEEKGWFSDGDEPYFVLIRFRSRFMVPNSTKVWSGGYMNDEWADGVDDGAERDIPRDMGRSSFTYVSFGNTPEVIGVLAIAMESDNTSWRTIRNMVAELEDAIDEALTDLIEEGHLNLANPGPDIRTALADVWKSVRPSTLEIIGDVLEAAGDPDDLIDYHLFVFVGSNAVPVNLFADARTTIGRLAERAFEIDYNPIVFRGDGATYQVAAKIGFGAVPGFPGMAPAVQPQKAPGFTTTWGKLKANR